MKTLDRGQDSTTSDESTNWSLEMTQIRRHLTSYDVIIPVGSYVTADADNDLGKITSRTRGRFGVNPDICH